MNERPHMAGGFALLIREWGTDARTGINSRVDVLGSRLGVMCTDVVHSQVEKDSLAGVKGGRAGQEDGANSDCR